MFCTALLFFPSQEVFTCINGNVLSLLWGAMHLGNTLPEQMLAVKTTAKALCDLIEDGHQVVVVHGNLRSRGRYHEQRHGSSLP